MRECEKSRHICQPVKNRKLRQIAKNDNKYITFYGDILVFFVFLYIASAANAEINVKTSFAMPI